MRKTTFKPFTALVFITVSTALFSQENEIPESGNVGLGTTDPTEKLDVRGGARIDSNVVVGDTLKARGALISEDLIVTGDVVMRSDVSVQGGLELSYLYASDAEGDELLLVKPSGEVIRGGDLKSLVYADAAGTECKDNNGGYTTPAHPTWANGPGRIYTTRQCVPDVKVGIGTEQPESKLHIVLNNEQPAINTPALIVEQADGTKILQLEENGLLRTREVKVDMASWPDYVFGSDYVLMPLHDVALFVEQYHHLPNVPSACEMENNGIGLAETNVMLMEKIEELTLYIIDLQKQIDEVKQTNSDN